MTGWLALIRERFPLPRYLPLVALFVAANGAAAARATGADPEPWRWAAALAVALAFFFRLRCFDEIKDYPADLEANPTRPLPRGALTIPQVERGAYAIAAAELAAAAALGGLAAAGAHALAIAYSLLMYREFFLGRYLRPRLAAYAATHTLVSVLLAYSIGAQLTGVWLHRLPGALLAFGLLNWMMFNLFELARRTYAPVEERPERDSYSRAYRPIGAAALLLGQVAVAVALVAALSPELFARAAVTWHIAPASVLAAVAVAYTVTGARATARALRVGAALYIVASYALLTIQLWRT